MSSYPEVSSQKGSFARSSAGALPTCALLFSRVKDVGQDLVLEKVLQMSYYEINSDLWTELLLLILLKE